MKYEIKNLFQLPSGRYLPCGMNIIQKLWWYLIPGVVINVKWPVGLAEINESMPQWDWSIGPSRYFVESADPNDHYRPFMEKYIGKQGWDWNWGVANNDVAANRLTIKIRQKHATYATILALRWS
jgi:hypothetical protein